MTIVYLSAIIFFILFFPLKLNGYLYLDINKKTFLIGIFLFRLKILSCMAYFTTNGFTLHYGRNKSLNLTIKDVFDFRNKLKPFKGYSVNKISFVLELGKADKSNPENYIVFLKTITDMVGGIIYLNNRAIEYSGNYLINLDEENNKLNLQVSISFNFFLIILSLLKIIIWKVVECVKKKAKKLRS